jgi:hypothetical protein
MDEYKRCPYCAERVLAEARKCKHCGEIIDRRLRAARRFEEEGPAYYDPPEPGSAATGLGVASLALGLLALTFAWIPCIGVLSLPLSGVGLILGIVGWASAGSRDNSGLGLSIAGTLLCLLAIGLVAFWWLVPRVAA